jgi:hypothetical protein
VVRARQEVARWRAADSLTKLALASHQYADGHGGAFPAAANFDKGGKPLLSWRVHLLPLLGEEKLYKEFHLDEPWDSDHNKKLVARMPGVYQGASRRMNAAGKTLFLAPVGKDVAFSGGAKGRTFAEFQDGTSNTILFVLADDAHAVEWTRPEDLKIDLDKPDAGLARTPGGLLVALADGSVRFLKPTTSKETLRAAFTIAGGEKMGKDW